MGNSQAELDNLDTYIHPRLGTIKRLQEDDSDQFLQYEVNVENIAQVFSWQVELNHLKNTPCEASIFLPIEYQFKKFGVCGGGGILSLTFHDFMFSLDQEIKNRKKIQRPFHETQIWFLLFNLVRAEKYFTEKGRKIGDIKPSNILLNEEGQIQIISQFSWPGLVDNFSAYLTEESEKVYLAPEEYKPPCMMRRSKKAKMEKDEKIDQNLSEMYSIGMTILEAASLMDCSKLYHEYQINEFLMGQYMKVVQKNYRRQLTVILRMLLKTEKRISCFKLLETLTPYEKEITNLEHFQFLTPIKDEELQPQNTIGSQTHRSISTSSPGMRKNSFNSTSTVHFTQKISAEQSTPMKQHSLPPHFLASLVPSPLMLSHKNDSHKGSRGRIFS